MKTIERKLERQYTPSAQPGFLGAGHTARPVIQVDFRQSDPFIIMMDDNLRKVDYEPSGGPHPHGGFETVSLLLDGEMGDGADGMKAGDFEMMTAGSGIVHTETIDRPTNLRLLQLWLNLPRKDRKVSPRVQRMKSDTVPVTAKDGVRVRVYSGSFAGATSPVKNHTPVIIAEVVMEPNTRLTGLLPSDFTAFLYTIEGVVSVGDEEKPLRTGEVGWLDRFDDAGESRLTLKAGAEGAHFVLYAGQPQHHEIVSHGPFIADTMEDIKQLYADYRAGRMMHIAEVSAEQQFAY